MTFTINLLHPTRPGNAWLQVTLAMDVDGFRRDHVRELMLRSASYLKLEPEEISVLSISRWSPIIELELPENAADRMVEAFAQGDPSLGQAFEGLELSDVRLDDKNAHIYSIPPASLDFWLFLDVWMNRILEQEWGDTLRMLKMWIINFFTVSTAVVAGLFAAPFALIAHALKPLVTAAQSGLRNWNESESGRRFREAAHSRLGELRQTSMRSLDNMRRTFEARTGTSMSGDDFRAALAGGLDAVKSSRPDEIRLHPMLLRILERHTELVSLSLRAHLDGEGLVQSTVWTEDRARRQDKVLEDLNLEDAWVLSVTYMEQALVIGVRSLMAINRLAVLVLQALFGRSSIATAATADGDGSTFAFMQERRLRSSEDTVVALRVFGILAILAMLVVTMFF